MMKWESICRGIIFKVDYDGMEFLGEKVLIFCMIGVYCCFLVLVFFEF